MKMMLRPSSRSFARTPNSRSISGGDKAEVGSSRMMMRAPENSTRDSSTSCCTPIGKSPSRARGLMSSPRFLSCFGRALGHPPPGDDAQAVHGLAAEKDVLGDAQFRRDAELLMHHADAGRQARRASSGNELPCRRRASSLNRPTWTPAMIFIIVLLPAPFSPARPWISPAFSVKSTFRSAWTPPNDFEMSVSSSSAGAIAAFVEPLRSGTAPPSTACRRRWPW